MTNLKYAPEEPIAAIATALAPAALGIVRCSGKNCIEIFSKIFSRPKALLKATGNTIVYGWIQKVSSEQIVLSGLQVGRNETESVIENEAKQSYRSLKIDEVLVSVFRAPHSFTGEDMIEISCHGKYL